MTTIATDGRSMAGDGRVTEGETITGSACRKVRRLDDGRLVGFAGLATDGEQLVLWLNGGEKPKLKDICALVLNADGSIVWYDEKLTPVPAEAPAAIGSGKAFALTAMDLGATPAAAVAAAARRDMCTGGEITVLHLEQRRLASAA